MHDSDGRLNLGTKDGTHPVTYGMVNGSGRNIGYREAGNSASRNSFGRTRLADLAVSKRICTREALAVRSRHAEDSGVQVRAKESTGRIARRMHANTSRTTKPRRPSKAA